MSLKLEIVTPTGKVLDAQATSISAPGVNGEFGVLPHHRPALLMLSGGAVAYEGPSGQGRVYIRGGVAEVRADGVLVLADAAFKPEALDRGAAEKLLATTEAALAAHEYIGDEKQRRLSSDRAFAEAVLKVTGH